MTYLEANAKQECHQRDAFEAVKKQVLQLIQNKVFLGKYIEKRYVESLHAYRDIIVIEWSEDIVPNLMQTKKVLEAYTNSRWIGISNEQDNKYDCLLWVQLNDVPVGKHWFQMSAIRFEAKEIILEIQHVQPYKSPEKSFNSDDSDFPNLTFKEILTYHNFREAFKFGTILFMTIITFIIEAVKYLGDFSIKLSQVIVSVIQVSIPIWLGMFEFLGKCIGGFYWLIYVMFRGNSNTPVIPNALLSSNQRFGQRTNYKPTNYRNHPHYR